MDTAPKVFNTPKRVVCSSDSLIYDLSGPKMVPCVTPPKESQACCDSHIITGTMLSTLWTIWTWSMDRGRGPNQFTQLNA
ncbi:hypothetical protein M8J75_009445 [Diaphorina citri]|nr:hypothetical protein M8J75_009445 [Diaphorina citri]